MNPFTKEWGWGPTFIEKIFDSWSLFEKVDTCFQVRAIYLSFVSFHLKVNRKAFLDMAADNILNCFVIFFFFFFEKIRLDFSYEWYV